MKKILFILFFIPFLAHAQSPELDKVYLRQAIVLTDSSAIAISSNGDTLATMPSIRNEINDSLKSYADTTYVQNTISDSISTIDQSKWSETGSDIYFDTGKVGIGTSSPSQTLHVNCGSFNTGTIFESTDDGLFVNVTTPSNDWIFGQDTDEDWIIRDVTGGNNDILQIENGATANSIYVDNVGVGILTTSPSEALDVDGNIDLNNTSTNQLLLPTTANLTSPTIGFDTGLGIYSNAGLLYFIVNSTQIAGFSSVGMFCGQGSTGNAYILRNVSSSTVPGFSFVSDTDLGIGRAGANQMSLIAGGISALLINDAEAHSVAGITNYETLVTDDDDIPNKKYVDDNSGGNYKHGIGIDSTSLTNDTIRVDYNNQEEGLLIGDYWYWYTGVEGEDDIAEIEFYSDGSDSQISLMSNGGTGGTQQAGLDLDTRSQKRTSLRYNSNFISLYNDSTVFQEKEVIIEDSLEVRGNLEVNTQTGAFIVSRMTTTERDALTAVNGMIIYNTTTNAFNFYENGSWVTK